MTSALALLAASAWILYLRGLDGDNVLAFPLGPLVAAAALVHVRSPGAQMLARGSLWSVLLLAALMAQVGFSEEVQVGAAAGLTCGAALIVLGGRGARATSTHFRPIAYQTTLFLALTLAMADTITLAFWSVVAYAEGIGAVSALFAGFVVAMSIGMVGLYRLKTWGLAFNLFTNIAIAAILILSALDIPAFLAALIVTTALIQILLPIPLIVGIARGARRKTPLLDPEKAARAGALLAGLAVAVIVFLALQPLAGDPVLGRFFD